MFLATTALEDLWDKSQKIVFLGEWCKLYDRKHEWSKLQHETLPYHWDDGQKLYKDYLYLNALYEEILPEVSKSLNKIHGVNHSVRYWRIIVGLWLLSFIFVLFDRYQSILSAAEYAKVKNTLIIRADRTRYVPNDFGVFSVWAAESDEYNCYLYSRIIEYMDRIPFEYAGFARQGILHVDSTGNVGSRSLLFKKIIKWFFPDVLQLFNKIALIETGLRVKDFIQLQLSLNQIPYLVSSKRITQQSKINAELRDEIHLLSPGDKFQKLLMRMIPEHIPALYVEGYANMKQISLKAYPRKPKIIFNDTAYNANEPFKFWAAHNVDHGIKLLGNQHGGLYGSGALSAIEEHQIKICDTFYTWGWRSDRYENTKPLMAAKLNTIKREIHPKKGGRLLLVEGAISRYSFIPEWLFTSSSGFLAYLNEQFRFVSALSARNKKLLLVRLYMYDYQFGQKDRWVSKFPEIECSHANESIINQINMSRLFIGTYNGTTYLWPFVANFPTVLFWNPEHGKTRTSAAPYFDRLREVGILHDTPEQAADKVNEMSEDPISWWKQPDIQEAKDAFCLQYASTSDKWLKEWRDELRNQVKISV